MINRSTRPGGTCACLISRLLTRKPTRLSLTGLAMLTALMPMKARSELLDWDITSNIYDVENLPTNPGTELYFTYNILNLSEEGDANNLISLTLAAGSNQGVYNATRPTGWTFTIYLDTTVFLGNGNYIPPNDNDNFGLYSIYHNTSLGTANATSEGTAGNPNIPFPQLNNITLPSASIPEPTTLSLILAGAGAYLLGRRKPRPGNQEETAPRKQGGSLPAA